MSVRIHSKGIELTDKEIEAILTRGFTKLGFFAKMIFPERFTRPFDAPHRRLFQNIERARQNKIEYGAYIAPRGIGKTSIANLLLPAHAILYLETNYVVPVSASATLAEQQSENLKYELVNNPFIRQVFGNLKTGNFSKEQWVVRVGNEEICVMPRGSGQQVRGMLYRNSRPGRIVCDDLEDPENLLSDYQREKQSDWFFGDLLGCVDRGRDDWRVTAVGTIVHENCLIKKLADDPDWDSIIVSIDDEDGNSNFPNYLTADGIAKVEALYRRQDKVDVFAREYRSQPVSKADAAFKPSMFKHYDEVEAKLGERSSLETIVIVDPSRTAKPESAPTGIMAVGVDMASNAWYVRDCVSERLHYDEILSQALGMCERMRATLIGVEVTGLAEFATYPFLNEMVRRGLHGVEFMELHARGGNQSEKAKPMRARSLLPFYRQGLVFHNSSSSEELERQLCSFPHPYNWSLVDCLGYVPQILERGLRFMSMSDDPFEASEKEVELEYLELIENDLEPLPADWRVA